MQELVVVVQALKVNGQAPTLDSPGRAGAVVTAAIRCPHPYGIHIDWHKYMGSL